MFVRNAEEDAAFAERLKLMPCPHCKVAGSLNKHGFLRGFDEASRRRVTMRARRVFCSNRNARPGCGRTFSIWFADKIGRLSLTTGGLWRFLQAAVAVSIVAARRAFFGSWLDCPLPRSGRILKRICPNCRPIGGPHITPGIRQTGGRLGGIHAALIRLRMRPQLGPGQVSTKKSLDQRTIIQAVQ